jgi:hypothetical protein
MTPAEETVMAYLGIPETGGIPLRNLATPLQRVFHIKVEYAHLTVEQLTQAVAVEPAIVSLKLGPDTAHAVVVDSIRKGHVAIRDPWPEEVGAAYRLRIEDFKLYYEQSGNQGKALLFQQPKAR